MTHDPNNDPTPDELEQQQESDPAAEFQGRGADPEHPDEERAWPQAERLDEADPADLIEQARPADESPETADDER